MFYIPPPCEPQLDCHQADVVHVQGLPSTDLLAQGDGGGAIPIQVEGPSGVVSPHMQRSPEDPGADWTPAPTALPPGEVTILVPPPGGTQGTPETTLSWSWEAFNLPEPRGLGRQVTLWATCYHTPIAPHRTAGVPLRASKGRSLGPVLAPKDFCDAAMEGSVIVSTSDGRHHTFNVSTARGRSQVDCSPYYRHLRPAANSRFVEVAAPFGTGSGGFSLVPFRTLAVGEISPNSLCFVRAPRP